MVEQYDVVVIGAGMAGLTAARSLVDAGLRVLVLEAQNRIGGRILTKHIRGEAIELGAEFIHGRPAELWALIAEAGLETYERGGSQMCFENERLTVCNDGHGGTFNLLENLKSLAGVDLSFADYLDREKVFDPERSSAIGFVEGFNAADYRLASAAALGRQQQAEDAVEGDNAFRLRGGYDQLPAYLARRVTEGGGTLWLNSPVDELRWKSGRVEADILRKSSTGFASAAAWNTVQADRAIVTLPLGVLQSGAVRILPRPEAVLTAAAQLHMGPVSRFTLLFRERFWASLQPQAAMEDLSFLFATNEMPPVWWTPHPEVSNTLTGWVGGPRSEAFSGMSAHELGQAACAALGRIFSVATVDLHDMLLACETHNWQLDPYSLGAYSYIATGGLEAPARMTVPVEGTLYFAGEHTDTTGHWGTVHAAMRSGLRVAVQILNTGALNDTADTA